jgi:UrcA family protein
MNTQSIYRTAFLSAALSTLSLIGTTQVVASDLISAPVSIKVSYADLNLSSTAGASALYGRIKSAAKRACGYEGSSLTDIRLWKRCVHEAVDDAVGRVNSPLLTQVHTGKSPTVTAMLAK